MRQINLNTFRLAQRGTPRGINRLFALNVIRTRQPVSRADLARLGTTRGAVSVLVRNLIDDGLVFEGAKGEALRGRKPQFLYVDARQRCSVAVDLRADTRLGVDYGRRRRTARIRLELCDALALLRQSALTPQANAES